MAVKPGYKQTEVGVIPEDWEVKAISGIAPLQRGFDLPIRNISEGPYPIVYSNGVDGTHSAAMAKGPGVVTGRSGTLGKVHFIECDYWPHNTSLWVTRFNGNNSKFIYHLYGSLPFERFASGSGVPTLNRNDVHSYRVALPQNHDEQRAIATALSDMDALLDGLDRLIAKKRAIKQAAMQQLLTGQTRLPGFSGEWKVTRLGEYVSIRNQMVLPANVASETLCVELEHVGQGDGHLLVRGEARDSSAAKYRFQAGDVLFGRLRSYLMKYWLATEDGICTTEIWPFMFDVENVNPGFLFALVQTEGFIETASVSYGTHMPRADWSVVRNYAVHLPSIEEQAAIATILTDMDTEITALETRRTKTRALKQAMMQELLTGRTRLVMPDAKSVGEVAAQTEGRKANVHFLRSVLAAEIIDQLHDQPTFGHVKFEKMMFLVGYLCEVDTGSTYHRQAAGPYDNWALRSIDSQLQKQQWFDAQKDGGRYQYVPMAKRGGHKPYFDRYFSGISDTLAKILATFKTARTEQCEIVATLLAAWSDLLREKKVVSDEMIVHEVLHNWHEAKQRIPEERWLKALDWMREKGFVPREATSP